MNTRKNILIAFCVFVMLETHGQTRYEQQLGAINKQIATAWLHHDAAALMNFYADDAVSMPEYHLTLFGKKAIRNYLLACMDSIDIISYSRRTYDVTKAGEYLVETGTFNNKYSLRRKPVDYKGKYLAIWRVNKSGGLQLISEVTGTINYLERGSLPVSILQIPDTAVLPKPETGKIATAIQSLNAEVAKLVIRRRGEDFAKYYTADAIYMPYYMPMLIGRPAIDAYYREHEDPNTKLDGVLINASRIIEAEDYVLVDVYYRVDWRGDTSNGSVTGKNISVWKRDDKGGLLLFRQMAVHD